MSQIASTSTPRPTKEDPLALSLEKLGAALETGLSETPATWAPQVLEGLAQVEQALQERVANAASSKGPLASIDTTTPSIVRQATGLCRDYTKLLDECCALRDAFRKTKSDSRATPDLESVRTSLAAFLAQLRQDKETETKLVLDSVNTEIGAGD